MNAKRQRIWLVILTAFILFSHHSQIVYFYDLHRESLHNLSDIFFLFASVILWFVWQIEKNDCKYYKKKANRFERALENYEFDSFPEHETMREDNKKLKSQNRKLKKENKELKGKS